MSSTRIKSAFAAGLVLAAMAAGPAFADDLKIAFFASSAQNGFNQAIYDGIEEKAKELGVETSIYDGQFDAAKQYSQVEDVLASGNFDGFIIVPNDTVGIAGAVEEVGKAGKPLVTVLFPIGPDLSKLEPQVPGVTATVASPPVAGAKEQAEDVREVLRRQGSLQRRDPDRRSHLPVRQSALRDLPEGPWRSTTTSRSSPPARATTSPEAR